MKKKGTALITIQIILASVLIATFLIFSATGNFDIYDTYGNKARSFYKTNLYERVLLKDAGKLNEVIWANELFSNAEKEIDLMRYLRERKGEYEVYYDSNNKENIIPKIMYRSGDIVQWLKNGNASVTLERDQNNFVDNVKPSGEYSSFQDYLNKNNINTDDQKEEVLHAVNNAVENLSQDYINYINKNSIMKSLSKDFQYNVVKSGTNITVYHSDSYKNMKGIKIYDVTEQEIFNELRRIDSKYSLKVGVSSKLDPAGEYAEAQKVYDTALKFSPKTLGIVMIADLAAMLTVLILLAINILKRKDSLNRFDSIKTEIAFFIIILGIVLPLSTGINFTGESVFDGLDFVNHFNTNMMLQVSSLAIAAFVTNIFCLVGYISLFKRIRENTLWKNSVLYTLIGEINKENVAMSQRNSASKMLVFKFILCASLNMIIPIFTLGSMDSSIGILIALIIDVLFIKSIIKEREQFDDIISGVEKMAKGNLKHKFDEEKFDGHEKLLAEKLNEIGNGLDVAVKERTKSERMQTELITNVSHDIKTPLTSIIGYVDLIKKEKVDNQKLGEYIDGLDRTSQKLKTLMEDLMEVSKSGSGKMDLKPMDIDLVELTKQLLGDWQDRLSESGLRIITDLPEDTSTVYVDGKATSRILDNILGNVSKYALADSRVYIEIKQDDESKMSCLTIKNTSRDEIFQTADELISRFSKGDSARSGEGNGLGLAIAKNFTELMGGTFKITVDGDLFKTEIALPNSNKI